MEYIPPQDRARAAFPSSCRLQPFATVCNRVQPEALSMVNNQELDGFYPIFPDF